VIRPLTGRRQTVAGGTGSGPAAMEESLNVRSTPGEVNISGFAMFCWSAMDMLKN